MLAEFASIVTGKNPHAEFANRLSKLLSSSTPDGERDLVAHIELVLEATNRLNPTQRAAVERCINLMTAGMSDFGGGTRYGLSSMDELERYTYCVAGVVGEMITDLACDYSPAIAHYRERLYPLASRFGCGLQLVNILKDVWDDRRRDTCWLPREVLDIESDLSQHEARITPGFSKGIIKLIPATCDYLDAALEYTLLIPVEEKEIRRFLAWTLGFAVLTLRRIASRSCFRSAEEVKITRLQVRSTVLLTSMAIRSNATLRWFYRLASSPLRRLM